MRAVLALALAASAKYDNATDTATAGARLKFADSTGIRTRNFAYVLIDDSGTCPDSSIDKRADV